MATNFDHDIDRRVTNSIKWAAPLRVLSPEQAAADPLPMWVADMDFKSPPSIIEALEKAVRGGIFGYSFRTDSYDEAICGWQEKRFGWKTQPEWLVQVSSVVTGLNLVIQNFTKPGDGVLVQSPVYGHFFSDVIENGRQIIEAPLQLDEQSRSYSFAPDIFESSITPKTKIFLLCNPHNPTGNIWSEAELRQMGEICLKHGILVVSDEIHQDLIFNPARKHIPFASLGDEFAQNSIICTAPSKTFNVAGLKCANMFIANGRLRDEVRCSLVRSGTSFVNMLGAVACEAAYRHGEEWLDDLLVYIGQNHRYFGTAVHQALPELNVFKTDALYLAWMDCRGLGLEASELEAAMLTKARVWFNGGAMFGRTGQGFMRVNLACPRSRIEEAVTRMTTAFGK